MGATDTLVVEEPLELRVGGQALAVTMRTPGDDMDLFAGFLVGEGVIRDRDDLPEMRYCAGADETGRNSYNVLEATLASHIAALGSPLRSLVTTSACGLCGKASIDSVEVSSPYGLADDPVEVSAAWIAGLPDRLRAAQQVFDRTGGLHAAALFDVATDELLVLREDVGRHNAVDKVIGWGLREGRLPLRGTVLLVSGRASFELAQKAAVAGVPILAAISAPSSLAVDLADRVGLTLIGFLRDPTMVVYSNRSRVRATTVDAIVLAGGEARRLGGVNKPALTVRGRRLLDIAVDAAGDAAVTVVVGPTQPTAAAVTWVQESPPGGGPVAALAAGLGVTTGSTVVVLAADLPFVTREVVAELVAARGTANAAIAVDDDGRDQPLLACYDRAALAGVLPKLPSGTSMRALVRDLETTGAVHRVRLASGRPVTLDCDTAADIAKAEELA